MKKISMDYDIIIPVAKKDTNFVPRVVKYVKECFDEVDIVYIITNVHNIGKIKRSLRLYEKCEVLDEDTLLPGLTFENIRQLLRSQKEGLSTGWFFQQFLKLGFAETEYAKKYYLTWDADTLPLSHIKFFEGEHPYFTKKYEYNANYFVTIEKILGLQKETDFSFIAEHMIFSPNIVKQMLRDIEHSSVDGNSWFEKIINAGDYNSVFPAFSEFETYGTYVYHNYPNLYKVRQLNTFRCGGYIQGYNITDKKLKEISFDTDTISFEIKHEPLFPYNLYNKLALFQIKLAKARNRSFIGNLKKIIQKIKAKLFGDKQKEEYLKKMTRH